MSIETGGAGNEEGSENTVVEGSESALDVSVMFGVSVGSSFDDESVGYSGSVTRLDSIGASEPGASGSLLCRGDDSESKTLGEVAWSTDDLVTWRSLKLILKKSAKAGIHVSGCNSKPMSAFDVLSCGATDSESRSSLGTGSEFPDVLTPSSDGLDEVITKGVSILVGRSAMLGVRDTGSALSVDIKNTATLFGRLICKVVVATKVSTHWLSTMLASPSSWDCR